MYTLYTRSHWIVHCREYDIQILQPRNPYFRHRHIVCMTFSFPDIDDWQFRGVTYTFKVTWCLGNELNTFFGFPDPENPILDTKIASVRSIIPEKMNIYNLSVILNAILNILKLPGFARWHHHFSWNRLSSEEIDTHGIFVSFPSPREYVLLLDYMSVELFGWRLSQITWGSFILLNITIMQNKTNENQKRNLTDKKPFNAFLKLLSEGLFNICWCNEFQSFWPLELNSALCSALLCSALLCSALLCACALPQFSSTVIHVQYWFMTCVIFMW